jgi:hypothetical protein
MSLAYVDTSCLVAVVFDEPEAQEGEGDHFSYTWGTCNADRHLGWSYPW